MRVIDLIQVLQANGIPLELEICVENRSGIVSDVKDIAIQDKPGIVTPNAPAKKCIVLKGANKGGIIIP